MASRKKAPSKRGTSHLAKQVANQLDPQQKELVCTAAWRYLRSQVASHEEVLMMSEAHLQGYADDFVNGETGQRLWPRENGRWRYDYDVTDVQAYIAEVMHEEQKKWLGPSPLPATTAKLNATQTIWKSSEVQTARPEPATRFNRPDSEASTTIIDSSRSGQAERSERVTVDALCRGSSLVRDNPHRNDPRPAPPTPVHPEIPSPMMRQRDLNEREAEGASNPSGGQSQEMAPQGAGTQDTTEQQRPVARQKRYLDGNGVSASADASSPAIERPAKRPATATEVERTVMDHARSRTHEQPFTRETPLAATVFSTPSRSESRNPVVSATTAEPSESPAKQLALRIYFNAKTYSVAEVEAATKLRRIVSTLDGFLRHVEATVKDGGFDANVAQGQALWLREAVETDLK